MPRVGAAVLKIRYLYCFGNLAAPASQAFGTAGRVYITPIDVPWPVIVDRIIYMLAATSAGNVRVGIYREGATADSPAGAALVVESAAVAQGTANQPQSVTISDTILTPGQYFLAIQGSNTTGTIVAATDSTTGIVYYYDRAGGFGAFTDPCPTVAGMGYDPRMILRVKENLPAGYRL